MSGTLKPALLDRPLLAAVNRLVYRRKGEVVRKYRKAMKRDPDIAAPSRLSELGQWRKVFDRNPLFPVLLDKVSAKDWVRARCPDIAIPETVWVGTRPEDLPRNFLTADYVIKCTHGCNFNYFPGRDPVSESELHERLRGWLATTYLWNEEWGYEKVPRRIIAERIVRGSPLLDICIRVANGKALLGSIASAYKTGSERAAYFRLDGSRLSGVQAGDLSQLPADFTLPPQYFDAIRFSEQLGLGLDYVRVDFLLGEDGLFFSEMTLYPASGYGPDDQHSDALFQRWMDNIELSHFLATPQPFPRNLYAAAFRRWAKRVQAAPRPSAP